METHSSILAWKIPWTEEPGRLESMESQRVGHNWVTEHTPLIKSCWSMKKVKMLVPQSCSTLCDPMDCSQPGSSVHGIFQARILELVAISYSRGSSWPRDRTCVSWIARQILYHCITWKALLYKSPGWKDFSKRLQFQAGHTEVYLLIDAIDRSGYRANNAKSIISIVISSLKKNIKMRWDLSMQKTDLD